MATSTDTVLDSIRRRAAAFAHVTDGSESVGAIPAPAAERLRNLRHAFALGPLAERVLLALFAAEHDPLMRLVARAAQGNAQSGLETGTIAELLDEPLERAAELTALTAIDGALHAAGLIECADPGAPAMVARVRLEPRVARYLTGDDRLPRELELRAHAPVGEPRVALDGAVARLRRAHEVGEAALLEIVGAPGTGKRATAHHVAAALGAPLVILDVARVPRDELERAVKAGRREARIAGARLCLAHWDAAFADGNAAENADAPRRRATVPTAIERALDGADGPILLTADAARSSLLRSFPGAIVHLDVPFPGPALRARVLTEALAERGVSAPERDELEALARRFALDLRRLRAAARDAADLALVRGTPLDAADVARACRGQLCHELDGLSDRVTAGHRLSDLVVSQEISDALEEMVAFVREARTVYDEWGFARRHSLPESVSALFSGPPGTGKTMCASAIARELDMELYRVDLSRVTSKWVGETEKNLGRVFDEAERSSAILLFDEADALFAKRTGVKSASDRYANLEVNYLLQRLEQFRGITILTTNYEDTIDPAFKRRLTFRLRFEKPDLLARADLWSRVFPFEARLASDIDPSKLAHIAELSGAGIRNAAVRAAFLAAARKRPIDHELCVLAAVREATEMGLVTHVRHASAPADSVDDAPPEPARSEAPSAAPRERARAIAVTHPRRSALI